jgi:hypothetical protein
MGMALHRWCAGISSRITNNNEPITNHFILFLLILLSQGFLLRFTMADKPADKLITPHFHHFPPLH